MKYQRKDDHSKTCDVDYIVVDQPSVIIFDDKPFRVVLASEFEEEWEPTVDSAEVLSPIIVLDRHMAIAQAAIEVCQSSYAACDENRIKAKVNELRDMLHKAGYEWEQPT